MGADYASRRRSHPVLRFRLLTRAEVVASVIRRRRSRAGPPRVIELGAADGRGLDHLRRRLGMPGHYHGLERDPELVRSARDLLPDVTLLVGDACRLPVRAANYDVCAAPALLEHVADPLLVLRGALTVLVPGGLFIATCPDPRWDRLATRLGLLPPGEHVRRLSLAELRALLEEAGFVGVTADRFMWFVPACLPYLRLPVHPRVALAVDAAVRKLRFLDWGFVNQVVVGEAPHGASL